MVFIEDEAGQGAAEYILLFGGIIVIVIAAFFIYRNYINATNPLNASNDLDKVKSSVK